MKKSGNSMRQKMLEKNFRIGKLIEEKINQDKITIDWNGHWENGTSLYNQKEFIGRSVRFLGLDHDFPEEFLNAIEQEKELDHYVSIGELFYLECTNCGASLDCECNGKNIRAINACSHPNGLYPMIAELNVPSGKIVFANDIRNHFPVIGSFDVNQNIGILATVQEYAKTGMMHFFVGNSCPGVWQVDDKHLTVSYGGNEEYYDPESKQYLPNSPEEVVATTPPGKEVGGICTDLWWYCAVDYDEFVKRCGNEEKANKELNKNGFVVTVKPGVYSFTHTYQSWEDYRSNKEKPTHWSLIEWCREPDEIKDYKAEFNKTNITAGQVIWESIQNYPTLYVPKDKKWEELTPDEKMYAMQRVANHIFCVNGNGIDWHPNGWGASVKIEPDAKEIEIPIFDKQFQWYDISPTYSAICCAAGMFEKSYKKEKPYLNESFRALAFNILNCVVRYGITPSSGRMGEDGAKILAKSVENAHKALKNLAKEYPDSIPDYCKDLL